MQHAGRSIMHGCQSGSLSGRKPVSAGRKSAAVAVLLNLALAVQYSSCRAWLVSAGIAGRLSRGGLSGFGGSCSLGGSALFQGTPVRKLFGLLVGFGGVQGARFVLFYAANSGLSRRGPD